MQANLSRNLVDPNESECSLLAGASFYLPNGVHAWPMYPGLYLIGQYLHAEYECSTWQCNYFFEFMQIQSICDIIGVHHICCCHNDNEKTIHQSALMQAPYITISKIRFSKSICSVCKHDRLTIKYTLISDVRKRSDISGIGLSATAYYSLLA